MLNVNLTTHASKRMQQRGVPGKVLPLLLAYGEEEYDHRGARIVYLSRKGRERIAQTAGKVEFKLLQRVMNVYAVLDANDFVITIGHRTHRVNRN
jgi:hypothetical protein